MTRSCAWCKKDLGEKNPEHPGVTHGICEDCAKKIKEEYVSKHHEEYCVCGVILGTVVELEAGLCLECLQGEDRINRLCNECSTIVDDPALLVAGRCPKCIAAEKKLTRRVTPYSVLDNTFRGYTVDEYMHDKYGQDMGLARDDERQRRGNKECS